MAKTKKQIIITALEAKGLEVDTITFQPISKAQEMCGASGGWEIYIDEKKTPLRGADNPIVGYNTEEILQQVKQLSRGYDFCPACGIGIDHHEERAMFCENCRTDFSEMVEANGC